MKSKIDEVIEVYEIEELKKTESYLRYDAVIEIIEQLRPFVELGEWCYNMSNTILKPNDIKTEISLQKTFNKFIQQIKEQSDDREN